MKYESTFSGLIRKGRDIDDIYYKYNEHAKDNGFKLSKNLRKSLKEGGAPAFANEYAIF